MKESEKKLLNAIYQNVKTAMQSIEDLKDKIKDENLKIEISQQLTNYTIFAKECEMLAKAENFEIRDINWLEKTKLWGAINLKTMTDKSNQNIAEMMILGTVMGIVDMIKEKSKYDEVSTELKEMADKLEGLEESYYQNLKIFLVTK